MTTRWSVSPVIDISIWSRNDIHFLWTRAIGLHRFPFGNRVHWSPRICTWIQHRFFLPNTLYRSTLRSSFLWFQVQRLGYRKRWIRFVMRPFFLQDALTLDCDYPPRQIWVGLEKSWLQPNLIVPLLGLRSRSARGRRVFSFFITMLLFSNRKFGCSFCSNRD